MSAHPNTRTLRQIYADLSRIADFVNDDVVLHTAEREIPGCVSRVHGKSAVLAKERELIRLTGGTLEMQVRHIAADDHFGAVLGNLHAAQGERAIAMPFCGVWRFLDGRIVEHWENAYDAAAFGRYLMGGASK